MRLKIPTFLVSAALAASMPASAADSFTSAQKTAPDTLHLPLDSCIAIALDKSPTISIANLEVKRMDYSRRETLGQLLPNIGFSASYNRTLAKQTMYMNMSGFGGSGQNPGGDENEDISAQAASAPSGGIKVGLDNSYSAGFSASMPLIAPQLWKSLDISDSRIAESVENARQSKLTLVNEVRNAYYTLLLAHDSRNVIAESYEMAQFTADLYEKMFAAGTATRYDVLRTRVAVQNIEPQLVQADISIRQARLQLAVLMGIDASAAVVETDRSLASFEQGLYERALRSTDNISGNSSLRMLDIQARQAEQNVSLQKLSFIPTLALTANYNWTSMNNGAPFKNLRWNPYSMLGVTLSVPLFEGLQRHSRLKQAQIQSREMSFRREDLVRNINNQVTLALDNLNQNLAQVTSCSESVRQAVTAHSIMKQSFEIGAASYLELRDAELALTQSRLTYYQAIYNTLIADSSLDLLLGLPAGM